MKRGLLLFFSILSLVLSSYHVLAGSRWIGLYIPPQDRTVDLGTIDGSCYNLETGSWCTISDGKTHSVSIFMLPWFKKVAVPIELAQLSDGPAPALPNSSDYALVVTARDTGTTKIDDLGDFQITGGDLRGWSGLDKPVTLFRVYTTGIFEITDIQYRYQVDLKDKPGIYGTTITYTLLPQ